MTRLFRKFRPRTDFQPHQVPSTKPPHATPTRNDATIGIANRFTTLPGFGPIKTHPAVGHHPAHGHVETLVSTPHRTSVLRRRETKAVPKSQASHIAFSGKLIRIRADLTTAFKITKEVIARDTLKKEVAQSRQQVWDERTISSGLKSKFLTHGTKANGKPLVDKERVLKKPKVVL